MDIMVNVGNKLANDFWEYKLPNSLKKPNLNSNPEDIKKFVNEKYIKKLFAPAGFTDPVKEYKDSKARGIPTKPSIPKE
jgi:hypothetical protein